MSMILLSGGLIGLLSITLGFLFSWSVLFAFVFGALVSLAILVLGFYQLLRISPALARDRTDKWMEEQVEGKTQSTSEGVRLSFFLLSFSQAN